MKRNRTFIIQSFQEQWTCPITSMPMIDPVLTLDGHSYQKNDIMEWLKKQRTSPKTGLNLNSGEVIPNIVLKNVIQKFDKEFKYQYQNVCTQNKELAQKIQEIKQKTRQQKNQIQNEYKQLKAKYAQLLNNSKKISESFLTFKKDNETLKTQNTILKNENNILKSDIKSIDKLKQQNKLLKQEGQKYKKQNHYYSIQNQTLIQQRIQNNNHLTSINKQNQSLKRQNTQLKSLLDQQKNRIAPLVAKVQQCRMAKQIYQQTSIKYQQKIRQMENYVQTVQKHISKPLSNNDFIKDNQIQRMKLQVSRHRIQNNNLKVQIKDVFAELQKVKFQHQKLKKMHSFCIDRAKQQSINSLKQNNQFPSEKWNKIEQQKQLNILKNIHEKSFQKNQVNPVIKPGFLLPKKEQYAPAKPWQAPQVNNSLSGSLQKIKNNDQSIVNKLQQSSNQLQNIFGINSLQQQKQLKSNVIPELKPIPLHRVASQPSNGYNPFHSFIRESVNQKMQKIQQQQKLIKHILPFKDYFLNNPVLFEEQKSELDHSGHKINMDEFLKYNWSQLKTLNLSDTQIDDKGLQMLANQAIYFNNLEHLWLWNNLIVNIPKFALQRFKNLKTVFFSIKGRFPNPLNQTSKQYLKVFQTRNPTIKVSYDNKPL